ncbi:hypothetical protein C484_10461 [Natrialba taiwanensis DSM 12281]|uniref:Uncharacterized protein n=2 Tax=Natrialba taiwanensis TaxID=160846 RepID=M0A277_9EURY|nr:hypothetical protein C484_10461 [Natrialba taiwanensis DSM 12281]
MVTTLESDDAAVVEQKLHQIYSASQKTGEWFKLTHNDINSFVALNQLDVADVEALGGGMVPQWIENGTNLYIEVEKNRQGGSQ